MTYNQHGYYLLFLSLHWNVCSMRTDIFAVSFTAVGLAHRWMLNKYLFNEWMNEWMNVTQGYIISTCSLGLAGQEVEYRTTRGRIMVPLKTAPRWPPRWSQMHNSRREQKDHPAEPRLPNCSLKFSPQELNKWFSFWVIEFWSGLHAAFIYVFIHPFRYLLHVYPLQSVHPLPALKLCIQPTYVYWRLFCAGQYSRC